MSRAPSHKRETREDGRDTRWDDHRAQRRDTMLSTAIAEIEANGTEIAVAQIAAGAGIPRSVVYRLFRNREDLDEQIRTRIVEDLMSHLAPALDPEGTIREAIADGMGVYVGWVSRHPRLHEFLGLSQTATPGPGSRVVSGTRTAIAGYLAALLELQLGRLGAASIPTGEAENVAFGVVGLVEGTVSHWISRPEDSRTSEADLIAFLSDALWATLASAASRQGIALDPEFTLGGN